jgi:hypothetical protein
MGIREFPSKLQNVLTFFETLEFLQFLSIFSFVSFLDLNIVSISFIGNVAMNHPARRSPRKVFAPPLKITRRPIPLDDAQTLALDKRIFLALVCIRIFNALTIRTFFQPDEYYQSLEPAWRLVYGYGEITWEWKEAIRGFLYPSLFAFVWWVAKAIGIKDSSIPVRELDNDF